MSTIRLLLILVTIGILAGAGFYFLDPGISVFPGISGSDDNVGDPEEVPAVTTISFGGDEETTELLIAGLRGDKLDGIKAQRFTSYMLNYVSHFQDVFLQYRSGLVAADVWKAERQFLAAAMGLGGFMRWLQAASQYFLPEFLEEVDSIEPVPIVVMDQNTGDWIRATW